MALERSVDLIQQRGAIDRIRPWQHVLKDNLRASHSVISIVVGTTFARVLRNLVTERLGQPPLPQAVVRDHAGDRLAATQRIFDARALAGAPVQAEFDRHRVDEPVAQVLDRVLAERCVRILATAARRRPRPAHELAGEEQSVAAALELPVVHGCVGRIVWPRVFDHDHARLWRHRVPENAARAPAVDCRIFEDRCNRDHLLQSAFDHVRDQRMRADSPDLEQRVAHAVRRERVGSAEGAPVLVQHAPAAGATGRDLQAGNFTGLGGAQ